MKIRIIAVGKIKEDYLRKGISDYVSRLKHYAKIDVVEIKDSDKENEGKKILSKVGNEFVFVLSEEGEEFNSVKLAGRMRNINKDIIFIIGGPFGLSEAVKERADLILSLSQMTFTHEMARLFLVEQLYRSFMINSGKKYHK